MPLSKYDIQVDLEHRPGTSHAYMVEMVGSNKRVLDVGCDTGYLGEALQALGNSTVGFEVNETTAQQARTRINRVEVGDLESTDLVEVFGRGSFDVVIFGDVLEHLRDPLPVLRQARPLLAPGGSVIISTPNIAHGDVRLALLQGRFQYNKVGILDETHTKFFTRDTLVQFMQDAGFTLVELKRTMLDLFESEMNVRESDFDPALIAKLRADPEALTYQFVVRGVPDDSTQISSDVALLVDRLQSELRHEHDRVRDLAVEREQLLATIERLTAQLAPSAPAWRVGPFPGRSAVVRARNAFRRLGG
jgi:O-antigen biosynthesis protein